MDKLKFRGDPVNQPVNLEGFSRGARTLTGTSIETRHTSIHPAEQTLETDGVIIFEGPASPASGTDPLLLCETLELGFYEFFLDISQQGF